CFARSGTVHGRWRSAAVCTTRAGSCGALFGLPSGQLRATAARTSVFHADGCDRDPRTGDIDASARARPQKVRESYRPRWATTPTGRLDRCARRMPRAPVFQVTHAGGDL